MLRRRRTRQARASKVVSKKAEKVRSKKGRRRAGSRRFEPLWRIWRKVMTVNLSHAISQRKCVSNTYVHDTTFSDQSTKIV